MIALTALAITFAAPPAMPQRQPHPPAKPEPTPVGLPIFSSDGKAIGMVLATGIDEDGHAVLVAEIQRPLGIGPAAVAIPFDMVVRRAHRIELKLTEAEVRERLAGAMRGP